jgi:hypothetical protein
MCMYFMLYKVSLLSIKYFYIAFFYKVRQDTDRKLQVTEGWETVA